MKKLIAVIVSMTVLITSSAMILAENGKSNTAPSQGAKEKFQAALQNGTENMKKSEDKFEALEKKIEEKRTQIQAKKAAFKTKKEEFDAFKDLLSAKRGEMLSLRNTGNMLHAENAKLQGDLRSSLEAINESGVILSDETRLAMENLTAQIKELTAKIKATKGQIQTILKDNKGFIQAKDYVSMETAFDEIFAIEQFRNDSLSQINTLLQNMIKLLVVVA